MVIKEKIIQKTRKDHECNSCIWLRETALNEMKFTFSEYRSIVKAKQNKWQIPKGSRCIYLVGVWNGDFFASYSIPEIHQICCKYDIYKI